MNLGSNFEIEDTNVDIYFRTIDAFLELSSSDTLNMKRLESQNI